RAGPPHGEAERGFRPRPEILVTAHQRAKPGVLELLLAPERREGLRILGDRPTRLDDGVDVEERPVGVEEDGARPGHRRTRRGGGIQWSPAPRSGAAGRGREAGAAADRRDPARLLGRFDHRLVEAEAEELPGVAEGEAPRARAEDDQQIALARLPGGDRQVVAGLVGETRLEGLDAARVLEERDPA